MISLEEQSIEELQTLLDRKQHKRDCCSQKINRLTDVVRRVGAFQVQNHKGETVCTFFDHGASIPQGVTITQRPEAEEDFLIRERESSLIREATKLKLQRLDSEIKEIGDILRTKNRIRDREIQRIQEEDERRQRANIEREERLELHKILIPSEQLEQRIKKEWVYGGISKIEAFDWNKFNSFYNLTSHHARKWAAENFNHIPDPSVIDDENKSLLEKMNTFLFMETNSPTSKTSSPYAIILRDDEFNDLNIIKRPGTSWFKAIFNFEVTTTANVVKFLDARNNPRIKKKPTAPAFRNLFDLWTEWTRGMKVINQVIFNPKIPPGFIQNDEKSVFNEWEGFHFYYNHQYFLRHASVEEYDKVIQTFQHHFEDVICRKNPVISDYLIKWMAWVRQNPGEKSEVVPVLIGSQGCGKSMAIQIFCSLFGNHGKYVSDYKDILRQFNESVMSKKLFLGMDEVKFNDDDTMNALKNLVTGSERRTEQKFQEMKQVRNFLNLMMSTNNKEKLFNFDQGLNRRFLLIEVDSTYQGISEYFDTLSDMFIDGPDAEKNLRYLDHYLSTIDLSEFNVKKAPVTDVLINQIIRSLNKVEKWWFDILDKKQHFAPEVNFTRNGNPQLSEQIVDPECPTWLTFPIKLKDLWTKFQADTGNKSISQVDFTLSMANMVDFEDENPTTFPAYRQCLLWKDNLGGKNKIVKIRGTAPMTSDQGKQKLKERKRSQKRKRAEYEGTGVIRNFFQNS
jgi:hypothetical protein